eukprot:Skav227560  [mRNA]  locus=scaffold154:6446:6871:+ [translate_table: standard]
MVHLKYSGVDYTNLEVESNWWYDNVATFVDIWARAVEEVADQIQNLRKQGNPWPVLLLHCYGGINRSSSFAIALIMKLEHMRGTKKSTKEVIEMSFGTYRRALNPWQRRSYFIFALLAFEAKLKRERSTQNEGHNGKKKQR